MIYFDLEYEVELNSPTSRISNVTKTRAKTELVMQAVETVIDYLADECGFDASYYDNESILDYCKLTFSDSSKVDQYPTYYGDACVAFVYLNCAFDEEKFLAENG